jgi:hypothetical protein
MKLAIHIRGGRGAAPNLAIIIDVAQLFSVASVNNNNTIHIDIGGKISGEISVNQGVSQGCGLSPVLVSICSGDLLRTWKTVTNPEIQKNNTFLRSHFFLADDQIILQKSEHHLQTAVYKLTQTAKVYSFKICTNRKKIMAFSSKLRIRTGTVEYKEPIEQVPHFIT